MIDNPERLRKDLQRQVKAFEGKLTPIARDDESIREEWQEARNSHRIAADFEAWLPARVTQIAVAWILATVFVRFSEDNGLIQHPFLAGPGEKTAQARERQQQFYERQPKAGDYEWLKAAFDEMSKNPVAKGLFDPDHNPMWILRPEPQLLQDLVSFWRSTGADGEMVHDFTDPDWDTRFLGDLYQWLSDDARKKYALLQTPEFVERYILRYTLDEAIKEFGLEPELSVYAPKDLPRRLRVIDPACGSGHFLLGAFRRLLKAWEDEAPGTDRTVLVNNALESVHGVDKNPYAVAVARFRLLLEAMKAAGVQRLDQKVDLVQPVIAVGDSLLHGSGAQGRADFDFRTEDVDLFMDAPTRILASGSYHVVVGNPPYITPKDPQENKNYREYKSCSGKYALSVPFAERMFQLSIRGAYDGSSAGYVGQITANSFMKREFGKKLIEEYFPTVDLTHIIDTSGAFIPDHGTPTVILVGRRRFSRSGSTVRAVLSKRGEPTPPEVPADGEAWKAIETLTDQPGADSEWISILDESHDRFAKHPWSVGGGGAGELREAIEQGSGRLGHRADSIGITSVTGEDDLYLLPLNGAARRLRVDETRPMVTGDVIRDFTLAPDYEGAWTYDVAFAVQSLDAMPGTARYLAPYRAAISRRKRFGTPMLKKGLSWYEWQELYPGKLRTPLTIAFAFVATHNHFVLDRGGKVFKQSAPVIKLPEGTTEDEHLGLLGLLNSSAACFWLKQVSQSKAGSGIGRGVQDEEWENRYEFTGTKLEEFPLPITSPLERGRELDSLAQRLATLFPAFVCGNELPTRERLKAAKADYEQVRARMIALQEELDWDVYHRYGLITDDEAAGVVAPPESVPDLKLGQRAFEIVLGQQVENGETETQWFARHPGSRRITDIPPEWPEGYRAVVAKRIELIEQHQHIGLMERPEFKRRWLADPWENLEHAALRDWLLDRCEERALWFGPDGQPRTLTVDLLADALRTDPDVVAVARLYAGDEEADLADVLEPILRTEHVPYRAQLRYKNEGLVKRAIWERTWDRQREEDAASEDERKKLPPIPVPPKYSSTDFQKPSYWKHRGKLDVPKERFISYPDVAMDKSKKSLPLGWAGWDHREQAYALISLIEDRETTRGWESDRVRPLVEGLAEAMPWVRQWHTEPDESGESPATAYDAYLAEKRTQHGVTE